MKPRPHLRSSSMLVAALALFAQGCKPEQRAAPHAEPPQPAQAAVAVPTSSNPVQNEMRILHEAARDWVTAVANNTLEIIPASIGKVHEARMLTEKAVEAGAYKPPKNGDAVADFAKQDDAFHAELVKLIQAAKAKDLPAATNQLGDVLQGCTSCHLRFRF